MRHLILGVSALALSASLIGPMAFADDSASENVTLYRVFVGDHDAGKITAFDLEKPDNRWTFDTTGQNKLYSVNEGAGIVAVQSDNDAVNFINSGISLHSHGDHSDIEIADPAAVKKRVDAVKQSWSAHYDAKVKLNVLLIDELHADLADPAIGAYRTLN